MSPEVACLIRRAFVAPSFVAAISIVVVGMYPHIDTSASSTTLHSSFGSSATIGWMASSSFRIVVF
jgi:hypothetical protein